MSGFVCPKCGAKIDIFQSGGGKKMAEEAGVPFLGSIPIDSEVSGDSDKGSPFVIEHADSSAAKAFIEIVKNVEAYLRERENTKARTE
jgi:ATP-binding protein involved in chromosome partitioning